MRLAIVLCWAFGCSADDSHSELRDAAADAAEDRDRSTAPSTCTDNRTGGFQLIDDELDGAALDGLVYERPPQHVSEDMAVLREDACTIYRLIPCVDCGCEASTCPQPRDVGTVTVTGLGETLSIEPLSATALRYVVGLEQSDPSTEEGAAVTLDASGGDYEPFALRGVGVGQLVAPEQNIVVETGNAVQIEWEPPGSAEGLRMMVELRISEQSWIECEVPDTGALEISSALITALLDRRPSLTHGITLTRFSADSTLIEPGCVDLVIGSSVSLPLEIPSLIPCLAAPCPEGMTCQSNYVCE